MSSLYGIDRVEANTFRESLIRLNKIQYIDSNQSVKNTICLLIDQIVATDPVFCVLHSESEGSAVVIHLSRQIPLHCERIVTKLCALIVYFCEVKCLVFEDRDLNDLTGYLTDGLQRCPTYTHPDILSAMSGVLENNTHRIPDYYETLLGGSGVLLQLTDDTLAHEDVVVEAVRCIATIMGVRPSLCECIEIRYVSSCFDALLDILHRVPHIMNISNALITKLLVHCLRGIQNIFFMRRLPNIELGILFAAIRAYMFFGLTSHAINIPSQLYPTVATPYEPLTSTKQTKSNYAAGGKQGARGGKKFEGAAADGKTRSKKRARKKEKVPAQQDVESEIEATGGDRQTNVSNFSTKNIGSRITRERSRDLDLSWEMTWLKVSSSESEFSDTEGGGQSHSFRSEATKVRLHALTCFLHIVKLVDKKVMFGFWSSFLPDTSSVGNIPQMQSLFTAILKDPSPKCRMAAVACLTNMLESTKTYLSVAEEVNIHPVAFTSFSAVLSSMVREIHRCLLQALVGENDQAVLTHIFKCLGMLATNAPYQRLHPGLLSRVVKQTRYFFGHRDPNVRTACLTCIGAILRIKPPLMEISELVKPANPPVGISKSASRQEAVIFQADDSSLFYPNFSSPLKNNSNSFKAGGDTETVVKENVSETLATDSKHECDKLFKTEKEESETKDSDTKVELIMNNETNSNSKQISLDQNDFNDTQSEINDSGIKNSKQFIENNKNESTNINEKNIDFENISKEELLKLSKFCLNLKETISNNQEILRQKYRFVPYTRHDFCEYYFPDLNLPLNIPDVIYPANYSYKPANESVCCDSLPINHVTFPACESEYKLSSSVESVTPVLGVSGSQTPVFTDQMLQSHVKEASWIVKFCLKNISSQPEGGKFGGPLRFEPLPVRLEALQVLTNLVRNYFPVIRNSFRILQDLIQKCLDDSSKDVVLHGAKLLDELTQALSRDIADSKLNPATLIPFDQVLEFWLYLLSDPLPKLLDNNIVVPGDKINLVSSAALDCIANIGDQIFAQLPRARQMQCVTLVLGLSVCDDSLVKGSATRAIGIYVGYSSLRDDVAFMMDATRCVLTSLDCPNLNVKFKAAWAMANLCDSLVANKKAGLLEFVEEFPDRVLLQLMHKSGQAIKESDKISCNASRAIGNLLHYLPPHCFQPQEIIDSLDLLMRGLAKNMTSGTMKVRWNSCYAVSLAFKNPELPVTETWMSLVVQTLCKVVHTCQNMKVRINATLGLAALPCRRGYGTSEQLASVWASLVTGLETSESINDFAEFRYKDSLIENVCDACLHVLQLMELGDVASMCRPVQDKQTSFRIYMEKYMHIQTNRQEKSNVPGVSLPFVTDKVSQLTDHLDSLKREVTTDEHRRCLDCLVSACLPDPDSSEEQIGEKAPKSAFKQIYD